MEYMSATYRLCCGPAPSDAMAHSKMRALGFSQPHRCESVKESKQSSSPSNSKSRRTLPSELLISPMRYRCFDKASVVVPTVVSLAHTEPAK